MSLEAMNAVWKHSVTKGNALLTLLAIADNTNDDGFAWPSYEHIAAKTRLSKRTAQNMVSQLLEGDELSLVASGTQGRSNYYSVNIHTLLSKPRVMVPKSGAEPQVAKAAISDGNRGGKEVATEPSVIEPPIESTTSAARAADDEPGTLFAPPAPLVPEDEQMVKVTKVWEHYEGYYADKLTIKQLTPARIKRLKSALNAADGNVETLCKAVDGFRRYREGKPGATSLDDIFSSRPGGSSLTELLEFWCSQADDSPTMAAGVPSVLRERVTRRRLAVVESLQRPDDEAAQERARDAIQWLRANAREEPVVEGDRVVRWERVS